MEIETREKILFVDDEETILEIASEFFQHKGYTVLTAGNGIEAVEILQKERIDCCFTDINMPGMDGLELAEKIRMKDNTIPVVIMTGYPSLDNTIRTLKNGVVDFLVKPVNLNQMELCVRRVLRERQLFVENILLHKEVESKVRLEKLNQELIYKVEELHVLNRILSDLNTIVSSNDIFKRVVNMTVEIVHADAAAFYIVNEAMQRPVEVATALPRKPGGSPESPARPDSRDAPGGERTGPSKNVEQVIMENAGDEIPLLISDTRASSGLFPEIRSFMVVPLKIRDKVFGVLTASIHEGVHRFTEKDLYYLSFMTRNAAHAIENLALYENIYENMFSTLYAFVKAIEVRDPYTE